MMPRKKTWRRSAAKKQHQSQKSSDGLASPQEPSEAEGLASPQVPSAAEGLASPQAPSASEGCGGISDGGLANPLKPSVSGGSIEISDGGLAHPQKPSVSGGCIEISDGGLAHPQKPSVSRVCQKNLHKVCQENLHRICQENLHKTCLENLLGYCLNCSENLLGNCLGSSENLLGNTLNRSENLLENCLKCSENLPGNCVETSLETTTENVTDISLENDSNPIPETFFQISQKPVSGNTAKFANQSPYNIVVQSEDLNMNDIVYQKQSTDEPAFTAIPFSPCAVTGKLNRSFQAMEVCFGSFHQGNMMFSEQSRGSQCAANALCALLLSSVSSIFSQASLDQVLVSGDLLYNKIVKDLISRGQFVSRLLSLDEIPCEITVFSRIFEITKFAVHSGPVITSDTDQSLPTLHKAVENTLQQTGFGMVIVGALCSAVFIKDGLFCFFDSHSHGQDALSSCDGSCLAISFHTVEDLVTYMYAFYNSARVDLSGQFEILPVEIHQVRCLHDTDALLSNYFRDQTKKQNIKFEMTASNKCNLHQKQNTGSTDVLRQTKKSRAEYMRQYMRLKRKNKQFHLKELIQGLKSKQAARSDPGKHAKEIKNRQAARSDPEKHAKELIQGLESKQTARSNPRKHAKELKNKQAERSDPEKHAKELIQGLESKQTARSDPRKHAKELKNKQAARSDPEKHAKELIQGLESKQTARSDPRKHAKELKRKQAARSDPGKHAKELKRKQADRSDPQKHMKELIQGLKSKQVARSVPAKHAKELKNKQADRSDPKKHAEELKYGLKSRRKGRNDPLKYSLELECKQLKRAERDFREAENERKRVKRLDKTYRDKERQTVKDSRRKIRENPVVKEHESQLKHDKKYGSDINHCIIKFKTVIAKGPVYVCTCCHQTWFRHSVENASTIANRIEEQLVKKVFTKYVSAENREWICITCSSRLKKSQVPPLAVVNENRFPLRPKELELHQLEERLISLRIPFMQIRELPRGGQLSIKGNVINVPVDVQPVVDSLPRTIDSNVTVPVKLKKKLSYKKCDFTENVRPHCVITALRWLLQHSALYQSSGIQIDSHWIEATTSESSEILKELVQSEKSNTDSGEAFGEQETDVTEKGYDSDHFSEIDDNENVIGNSDTLVDQANFNDSVYTFAPGEGQSPVSLYNDTDAEYLAFPTIFCGQKRATSEARIVPVHYSDICKLELRHIDRRVATNVANIFFKMKKQQLKQVSDKVYLALRRFKTEGKKLTASQVLNQDNVNKMVRLDEGYYIFRSLRNSPPYLEAKKKEVFAMIRQLGLPTWFISLSSADTRWKDLLRILAELNYKKCLTDEQISAMSWTEKTKLVQMDPVTCVRYFDNRVQEFIGKVLKSHHNPIGKVIDYFYRVEFQQRGSPHIHMLMWIEGAPKFDSHTAEEIVTFIDSYATCSTENLSAEEQSVVEMQTHKHSKTCRKKGKAICRFGFPIPPMPRTTILEPLSDPKEKAKYKETFKNLQKKIDELKETDLPFNELLLELDLSEEDYMKAVQSSVDGPKVFLKRRLVETRTNAYMKPVLTAWGANHDLQYVLDAFACAVYIVSYISKAQRGMSLLMNQACKEARDGNMDLRRQVRHIGNKFLNSVEISAQEACYLVLQLPLTRATREVTFINTSKPEERTFILKSKEALEQLPEESTAIEAENVIKRFSKRPKLFENWCLADFVSRLEIQYPDKEFPRETGDINDDDVCIDGEEQCCTNEDENTTADSLTIPGGTLKFKSGLTIRIRRKSKVIRYVRFSKKVDTENYYRERLLLFYPWRNEATDIQGNFESYEARYMSVKEAVEEKAEQYEKNISQLNEAVSRAEEEEMEYDEIAPLNEQREQDDIEEGAVESEKFVYFDPDRPENQRQYDLGADIGVSCKSVDINPQVKTMPDIEYRALVKSLNMKQKEFFLHVLQHIKADDEPLHVFLSGGAGVGKSVVVKALYEALQRQLTSGAGENPETCKVLMCAPTGKAAYHISGMTLHSAFRIYPNQSHKPLDSDTLNSLRTKYRDLAVVLIDEISMVGCSMFAQVNQRLQQIKGTTTLFGGVHVIVIGDLFQLSPVKDSFIFDNLKANYGPLAVNLWKDLFTIHELDQIMRQKDDRNFAELLNRLREGKHTVQDIEVLKGQVMDPSNPKYPLEAVHIYNKNEDVDSFNQECFKNAKSRKVIVPCFDSVIGDDSQKVKNDLLCRLPNKISVTGGLSAKVEISVGLKYEVCVNIDVDDGLTNGTSCTVMNFENRQMNTQRPSIVWVRFDDDKVGSSTRNKYKHMYHRTVHKSWTPVFDVKRNFVYRNKTFVRIQFPLRQAMAKTCHKSQGDTLSQVVVDMSGKRVFPHAHYVAMSRAKSLQGLIILNLNESKISVSTKVKEEMERLRTECKMTLCYCPVYCVPADRLKCVFLNTRSLIPHLEEISSDHNILAANLVCLVETWLVAEDTTESIEIPGFHVIRQDGLQTGSSRPHRGVVMYVKHDVIVLNTKSFITRHLEILMVSLLFQHKELLIVGIYKSPISSQPEFETFLSDCLNPSSAREPFVMMGDFNSDIRTCDTVVSNFIKRSFQCVQKVSKPTHSSGSLIDHMYTNIAGVSTDVIECVWSDHSILYASISLTEG